MQNKKLDIVRGRAELNEARLKSAKLFGSVFIFSIFVNMLMLTGPLYMLQIYDRVLGSRSEVTLIALSVLVVFLYLMMGFLDYARGRVLARAGARFQTFLDERVFAATLRKAQKGRAAAQQANAGLSDLESIQRLLSSPVLLALCDVPWAPVFITAIFIFHPILGWLSVIGGLILIAITFLNQWLTSKPVAQANHQTLRATMISSQIQNEAELVHGLGMIRAAFARWKRARAASLDATISSSDFAGVFSTTTKTFRLFLQSAVLGVGAWLVLQNTLTPGAMIAASILLGRALAPIEQAIGQWAMVQRASNAWGSLSELLSEVPAEPIRTVLPKPRAFLEVQQVTVIPPGESYATLRMISFTLEPGKALGVIGPSGAGKSTLAKVITGVWPPAGGAVRLDGASLDQYDPEVLGENIGYLPQRVSLFDGTIAENIARLQQPDDEKVIQAAKQASAHDMIVRLPDGYNTLVSASLGRLSGGEMQRVALARALYGEPVLLVLDEPNSNLDKAGSSALNEAIRTTKQADRSVIIMAHRPAAIQECDYLMVIENGIRAAYGERDQVLRDMVTNHSEINQHQRIAHSKAG